MQKESKTVLRDCIWIVEYSKRNFWNNKKDVGTTFFVVLHNWRQQINVDWYQKQLNKENTSQSGQLKNASDIFSNSVAGCWRWQCENCQFTDYLDLKNTSATENDKCCFIFEQQRSFIEENLVDCFGWQVF